VRRATGREKVSGVTSTPSALRPLAPSDAHRWLALVEACDIADLGAPDYTIEDVEDDLARPTWRGWAIEGPDGDLRAYCWVERRAGRSHVEGDVRVHPDDDPAIGTELLGFVRARAAELAPDLPLHVYTSATALRDHDRLESAGGKVAHHYWRMAIDLGEEPPAVPAPAPGVVVEVARDDETHLRQIHHVIDTAFLDHVGFTATPFEEWVERHRSAAGADLGLWWLARVGGEPAGALVGRSWPDTGWVQGLGTLRDFRGHGLARLLLLTSFREFHRRGYRKVSLGVDATNPTGAVRLYRSVGMDVVQEAVEYELPPLPR
jgi:ribosomal protein S18 acetylase RimI-like enzyme